jgi:hypothetical protein
MGLAAARTPSSQSSVSYGALLYDLCPRTYFLFEDSRFALGTQIKPFSFRPGILKSQLLIVSMQGLRAPVEGGAALGRVRGARLAQDGISDGGRGRLCEGGASHRPRSSAPPREAAPAGLLRMQRGCGMQMAADKGCVGARLWAAVATDQQRRGAALVACGAAPSRPHLCRVSTGPVGSSRSNGTRAESSGGVGPCWWSTGLHAGFAAACPHMPLRNIRDLGDGA